MILPPVHAMRPKLRPAVLALGTALLLPTAACEPCSGIVGCAEEPRLAVQGQMVEHFTKAPVPGVRVEFQRTGGVELDRDTFSAVTNSGGRFVLSARAREAGTVVGDVRVQTPPPNAGYVVRGVSLATVSTPGDARVLPRWVVDPFEDLQWDLQLRAGRRPMTGATVEFVRTGGVPVLQQPYVVTSDGGARFRLHVTSPELGTFYGDLRVTTAGGEASFVVPDVGIATIHEDRDSRYLGPMLVGPWLGYVGVLRWSDDGTPAAGVPVRIRRTGGIGLVPAEYVRTTNEEGHFSLESVPVSPGTVQLDVLVEAPGYPAPFVIGGVELSTHEEDAYRYLSAWMIPRG